MTIHACIDCVHIITKPHVPVQNSTCAHDFEIQFVTGALKFQPLYFGESRLRYWSEADVQRSRSL